MMSDASDMLAAALEQMDGIIAGSKAMDYSNGLFDCQSPTSPFMGSLRALNLLEDLRGVLELMDTEEREGLRCQIPDATADSLSNGHHISMGGDLYQERLSRLEGDKESLVLQVSVLTDQVEAQGEKIRDLDMCLDEHREKLNTTEEMLQQELLCRTALETQKQDLMAEVSNLKLNSFEKDRLHFDFSDNEDMVLEMNELRYRVTEMESERVQYEKKLKSTKVSYHVVLWSRGITPVGMDIGDRDVEVQRMKKAVESLMAANEEKDRKIEELRQSLLHYKTVQDRSSMQGKKGLRNHVLSLKQCLLSCLIATTPVRARERRWLKVMRPPIHNPTKPHCFLTQRASNPEASRTNVSEETPCTWQPWLACTAAPGLPQESLVGDETRISLPANPSLTRMSLCQLCVAPLTSWSRPVTTEPGREPRVSSGTDDRFGNKKARSSFGRGFFKIKGGKRTASTPNLEREEGTDHLDLAGLPQRSANSDSTNTLTSVTSTTSPECKKKSKGIKGLFGKLRRSQSTTFNLDDNLSEAVEFKRGGVRATAGPRLGWSRDLQRLPKNDLDTPFARWSKEQVCDWLQEQGLGLYLNMARVWISSGQTLLQGSQQDLERELGIKHPLHRKKLQLALQALGSEEDDNKGKLDYNWVTRWLDDIGLPQYKTQFDEGRVDGRMLHYMTVDDLLSLKVGSVLHHLSIKRAIQVLRLNNYEPNCLRRRPSDENNITPAEISQWTNHRVMEWLRSVDLAEYAPNLRGSGVHGGLMVLEPRFNVETMALLLNIPPNKTLLRRHLATHFNLLVGSEAQGLKQDCLENPDYTLLTATAKVKPRKMSFGSFGSLRKKRQDDSEEYVCPMDVEMPKGRSFQKGYELQLYEDDIDRLEQMEDSEGTVRQIGAFSEGIQNLTVRRNLLFFSVLIVIHTPML
uniref:PPFIA binding protein 1b n=1 Tax=Oncorhynchus mykiss TaxID=8022 RepID=A0A8C7VY14_ONCMY